MAVRTQEENDERAFSFLRINDCGVKPRTHGITEIRGPYYSPLGKGTSKTFSKRWGAMSMP